MLRCLVPLLMSVVLLAGVLISCKKDPTGPPDKPDTSKCDTCHTDTTKCDTCTVDTLKCDTCNVPCDTCDTTHHEPPGKHDFTWTEYFIPGEPEITGVTVLGPNDIYANGRYMYHFNGVKWDTVRYYVEPHRPISGGLNSFRQFGFNANDLWLVYGSIIDHVTGDETAEEFRFTSGKNAYGVWGTNSSNIYTVGNYGVIMHYDGTSWTQFPKVTERNLRSVWGTSSSNVWAAGFNSTTALSVLLHYDGATWQEIDLSTIGNFGVGKHALQSVWAIDSSGHKITVVAGSLLHRRTDNGPWISDSGLVPNKTNDNGFVGITNLSGNSSTDFMAAGSWGWIAHWDGKTWKRFDELFNYQNSFYVTYSMHYKGTTACIVGSKGGRGWIAIGKRK